MLVHQCPILCRTTRLGAPSTHGHDAGRGTVRGIGQGEDRSAQRWLEVHERWYFDDRRSVQVLRRLICLCTGCHSTTHFGLATIKGRDSEALAHLCSVTGMSMQQARSHVHDAFDLWKQRSRRDWALDLSVLTAGGIGWLDRPTGPREDKSLATSCVASVAVPDIPTMDYAPEAAP